MMSLLTRFSGQEAPLPTPVFFIGGDFADDIEIVSEPEPAPDPDPISALACIIEYQGEQRFITCRRFDVIGENGYVGAICHSARGYRQFRIDRISSVCDALTGEVLGDGSYFNQFEPRTTREKAPTWGLIPSQKRTLIAGLNVLAFMARCDGTWHRLETEPVERFVCSLWIRKEWDGDPPVDEIVAHAQRLAPDADTFFRSLDCYARSRSRTDILTRAISDVIAADGVICQTESAWSFEIADYLGARARLTSA